MLLLFYLLFIQPPQIIDDDYIIDDTFNIAGYSWIYDSIGSERCMKALGCFKITFDFFSFFNRPLNKLPYDREFIDTKFELYTKLQPVEAYYLNATDDENIKKSSIDPNLKTMFIVHGFFDNQVYGKWMEELKTALFLHGDYNVIIVDWSKGNQPPYIQATANTRVVGAEIALLIQSLEKVLGISPMNCHIIGHSLGAHVAGYAGERLNKLGRITALDPAKPYFENMPPSVRIDPTDAVFVDAIHTDTHSMTFLAFGMPQPVGHVDFYPNDGHDQPSCTVTKRVYSLFIDGLYGAVRMFASCNHQRSIDYFIHTLNYKNIFPVSYPCGSWNDYERGTCSDCGKNNENCALMGMKAIEYGHYKNVTKPIKMYLSTTADDPYWVHSYQVTVKFANKTSESKYSNGDIIYIASKESNNGINFELSSKNGNRASDGTYTFFVHTGKELVETPSLTFKWSSTSFSIIGYIIKPSIYLEYVTVKPINDLNETSANRMTRKFCYSPKTAIKSEQVVSLVECS